MRTHILSSSRSRLLAAGAAAAVLSTTLTATNIGPVFDYKATDATSYSFIDVAASGGASVLTSTDDGIAALSLPFPFSFFGTMYSNLCVSSNGAAYFTGVQGSCASDTDFANTDLSSTPTPGDRPSLLPLWSDLVLAGPGAGVFYQSQGAQGSRKFIVQWNNAYPLSKDTGVSANAMTFELVLFEASNQILFQYKTVQLGEANQASRGAQATIGIRDAGSIADPPRVPSGSGKLLAWSHRSPVVGDGTAILFTVGKSPAVVTAAGGTFTYDGQPHTGSASAYGPAAEPLSPVDLAYEGTGSTLYPSSPNAPVGAGTYRLTAVFAGNDNYQGGSAEAPLTITPAAQTITFTTTPPASPLVGGTYTVGATASSGGLVAFSTLTGGTCTVNGTLISFVAAGTCTVAADQSGSTNYTAAPQVTQNVTIANATTSYTFTGFFQPIDMPASSVVWNQANAGRTIPVKWRLTSAAGAPVSASTSFTGIYTSTVSCSVTASADTPIDQYVSASGLQYMGDGNWQYNWGTQKTFAGSCRVLAVKFSDGSTSPLAYFKFSR